MLFYLLFTLQMVAQFFANIFFFLNGAMFNSLIDQGPQLGLFQYSVGKKVQLQISRGRFIDSFIYSFT